MNRPARAIEILEAIDRFYKEGRRLQPLSAYALIFDDDTTISDAIKDCLGEEGRSDKMLIPLIPRSKQRRWGFHFRTGYSGWIGKRKMVRFYTREEAIKWVNEQS